MDYLFPILRYLFDILRTSPRRRARPQRSSEVLPRSRSRSAVATSRAPPIRVDGSVPSAIHRRTVRTETPNVSAIERTRRWVGRVGHFGGSWRVADSCALGISVEPSTNSRAAWRARRRAMASSGGFDGVEVPSRPGAGGWLADRRTGIAAAHAYELDSFAERVAGCTGETRS